VHLAEDRRLTDNVISMMVWIEYLLLLVVLLAGLGLLVITMPGLWLMTAAACVYGLFTHFRYIGAKTLITLLLLSFIAEIVELTLGGAAAKKAGGGRRAMIGGLAGGVLGGIFLTFLIPIPVLGTIAGICLGSFLGAAGFELLGGQPIPHSFRVGVGAAKGRFMGIVSKLVFGIVMFLLTLVVALPVGGKSRIQPTTRTAATTTAP